jgi:S1-C subfamily serine protease
MLGGICCALFFSLPLFSAQEEQPDMQKPDFLAEKVAASIKTVFQEKSPAVVRIRCHDGRGEIVGTGFTIDPTGTICTVSEIVREARDITIEQGEKILPATLLAIDALSGIAFLKPETTSGTSSFLSPLSITNVPEFTPVISIGYPREQQASLALGMITGLKNHEEEHFFCVPHLTATLSLSEGEGGSPVLDLSGNLLGIIMTGNTQFGLCTILPSAAIEQLYHNFLRYGNLSPGWVGAIVEIAAVPQHDSQTRIVSVIPESPAEMAGIHAGDMLLSLGSCFIHAPEDVLNASFYLTPGEEIQVTLLRKGKMKIISLQCGERPSAADDLHASNPAAPTTLFKKILH